MGSFTETQNNPNFLLFILTERVVLGTFSTVFIVVRRLQLRNRPLGLKPLTIANWSKH